MNVLGPINIKTYNSITSITKINPDSWLNLQVADFPFTDYSFLSALETTSCLGERTGWSPLYLTAWHDETLLAALVLYSKNNSYGEFIFDFAWAQAAQNAGISYYPKLLSAIPFSPATGSKILIHHNYRQQHGANLTDQLLLHARKLSASSQASSVHFLFIPEDEISKFSSSGYFIRHSFQYHWQNLGYRDFDEFLSQLTGKRRREIVRERRQIEAQNIKVESYTGPLLEPYHADLMYDFYLSTIDKKQSFDYLTHDFFRVLLATMKDKIHLVLAKDSQGQVVAGALNIIGSERLFGRYWGCLQEYKSLHFEVCYYQGIEYCIQNKLKLFEAGAQGEHKFQRGFLPALTYSAHWLSNDHLSRAIVDFVNQEKKQIEVLFKDYAAHSPYSQP